MTCTNPDCRGFPHYGPAPHECYWRKPGGFDENALGTSTIKPLSEWPANFYLEYEDPKDVTDQLTWGACGAYTCPECGSGFNASRFLSRAQVSLLVEAQPND